MIQDQIFLEDRHKNFVKKVSENEIVYALKNDDGFATSVSNEIEDEEGNPNEIICFWSDKARAKSCIKDEWSEYEIKELHLSEFLENWCIGMHNDGLLVGMDFDHNLFGYEIEPLDLTLEIIIRLNLYNKQVMFKKFDRIENLEIQIRNVLEN